MRQLLRTLCGLAFLSGCINANAITISGRVSFPDTPSYTLTNASIGVRILAEQGAQQFQQNINLSTSTPSSGDFSIDVGDLPLNNVEIDYFCFSGCDDAPIMNLAFLSDSGSTYYANTQRTIPIVDADLTGIDLPLLDAILINGSVSIEPQESSSTAKDFSVSAFLTPESRAIVGNNIATSVPSAQGTIGTMQSSGNYTLKLPKDSGVSHTISITCFDCNIIQRFGIGADGQPKEFDSPDPLLVITDDQNFNNIDLEIPFGNQITGTIELANGATITAPVEVGISLFHRVGSGFSTLDNERINLSPTDTGVIFELGYLGETEGDFVLSFGCNPSQQDCGNLQDQAYFTLDDLKFDNDESTVIGIPLNAIPSSVDLVLPTGDVVNGTVQLPESFSFNGFLNLDLIAVRYDATGEKLSEESTDITFSDNLLISDFATVLTPLDSGETYEIFVQCLPSCGTLSSARQFLQSDGSTAESPARLSTIPSSANFDIPLQRTISGFVTLPDGETADSDYQISLRLVAYSDREDFSSFQDSSSASVTIPAGAQSIAYQVVIPGDINSFVTFNIGCTFGQDCGRVLGNNYTSSGFQRSISLLDAVKVSDFPETLDLELLVGESLMITTNLEGGSRPTQDTEVFVGLNFRDVDTLDFLDSFSIVLTIPAGSTQATGEIIYPPTENAEVLLSYGCFSFNFSCGVLRQTRYFTPTGIEVSSINARFPSNQIPSSVNLVVEQGDEFSGTIGLPNSELAAEELDVFISLEALDENNFTISESSRRLTIPAGSNSVDFLFGTPADTNSYLVRVSCSRNCENYVQSFLATPDGAEFVLEEGRLSAPDLGDGFNIELVEGQLFEARLALPNGVSNSDISMFDLNYFINIFDAQGRVYDRPVSSFSVQFTDDNTTSDPISRIAPLIPAGGYATIGYGCNRLSDSCKNILSTHYFTQGGPVFTFEEAEQLTDLSMSLVLDLVQGTQSSFQVERPLSQPHSGELVYTDVAISVLDEEGLEIGKQEANFIFIGASDSQSLEFSFPLLNTIGRYRFTFSCRQVASQFPSADCSRFDNDHPNNTFEIDADSLPNPIRFQYVAAPTPILPDAFEVDNSQASAKSFAGNIIQNRTIHEAGDTDWLRFSLGENTNINIEAQNLGDEGQPQIALLKLSGDDSLETIETRDDSLSDAELNNTLSLINIEQLEAGDYFIKIEGFSPTSTIRRYQLKVTGVPSDLLCIPIKATDRIAVVCL